jgi:hypothetical protein
MITQYLTVSPMVYHEPLFVGPLCVHGVDIDVRCHDVKIKKITQDNRSLLKSKQL